MRLNRGGFAAEVEKIMAEPVQWFVGYGLNRANTSSGIICLSAPSFYKARVILTRL